MVIRELPFVRREGYIFDKQILRLELYRLLCYFVASETLADNIYLSSLLDEFQDDQILITLISIAVSVRIIDDRENRYLDKMETKCGTLTTRRGESSETCDLNLREACNKIIHARNVRFDVFDKDNRRKLQPILHLYGEHRGTDWEATLDILQFGEDVEQLVLM